MVRPLLYMLKLGLLVALAVWLAEQPGQVAINWQGYLVETSVGVLLVGALILMVLAGLGYHLWRKTVHLGRDVSRAQQEKRRQTGYRALTRGLIAAASGDAQAAARHAQEAQSKLDDPGLTLLLSAQAAQLTGDDRGARKALVELARNKETAFVGLRGLLTLAIRKADWPLAVRLARRTRQLAPRNADILTTLFSLELRNHNLDEAESALVEAVNLKAFDEMVAQRHRAALALAKSARAEEQGRAEEALAAAHRAHALMPDFGPAAEVEARLLGAGGRQRQAEKVILQAWRAAPYPGLARAWADLAGEDAMARFKQLKRLHQSDPSLPEGRLALAEAALEASLWGEARGNLTGLLPQLEGDPLEARACRLMAKLERGERNDAEAASAWLERADRAGPEAVWACNRCGTVHARWQAVCRHCAAFDEITWQVPRTVPHEVPVIENRSAAEAVLDSLTV